MTKWEYKTVPIPPHIAAEVLNTWGDDGWELVCVFSPPEVGGTFRGKCILGPEELRRRLAKWEEKSGRRVVLTGASSVEAYAVTEPPSVGRVRYARPDLSVSFRKIASALDASTEPSRTGFLSAPMVRRKGQTIPSRTT